MSEAEIAPDWKSLEVLDILQYHVSPALNDRWTDLMACRLVCRAWRTAFPPPRIVVTLELAQSNTDAFRETVKLARKLSFPRAGPTTLEWFARVALENPKVTSISLTFPYFSVDDAKLLSDILCIKLHHLRSFTLDCPVEPPLEALVAIAQALEDTPNALDSVDFSWCRICYGAASALLSAIVRNKTIRKLDLTACDLAPTSQDFLLNFIKDNQNVTDLCLSSNWQLATPDDGFSEKLRDALAKDRTLKVLNLNACRNLDAIGGAFKFNNTLQRLSLGWCKLDPQLISAFFAAIENNRGLRELKVHFDLTCAEAPSALGKFFKSNSTLQTLELNMPCEERIDYGPIFDGLAHNTTLTSLDALYFAANYADQLAEFIEQRAAGGRIALKKIGILYSDISEYGSRLLKALLLLPRLENLDLMRAPPDPDSVEDLVALLQNSTSLTELSLYQSRLGDAGMIRVCAAVAQNSTLRHLAIGGDQHQENVHNAVCDMIVRNSSLITLDYAGTLVPAGLQPNFDQALKASPLTRCDVSFSDGAEDILMDLIRERQKRG
eukprot:TRINITY_DN2614_c0_g1_i1.p1 TRINITY_DN2614_c0_g1~~TRINITY_DN2614_c0_g1_i1.p1  ORF type:complete len:590 (+),score=57.44 TRINITY_DN2614_c0_g1_i1:120-1772(+)